MVVQHTLRVLACFLVATSVACSKPEPKPDETRETNETQETQATAENEQEQAQEQAATPPTSGEYACADSAPSMDDVEVEAPSAEKLATPAPELRFELPEALEGLEPPDEAKQPIETTWCEKAQGASQTEALLTDGRAFTKCCTAEPKGADFQVGCMMARGCSLELPNTTGKRAISTADELAEAVAPVDSVAEAMGLVAVQDQNVWVPYGPDADKLVADTNRWFGWYPLQEGPVKVEAEEHAWGYVLRVPAYAQCGCSHHLYKVAYRVTKDGTVCRLGEKPKVVAYAQKNICID
jgi:hypothetical protein